MINNGGQNINDINQSRRKFIRTSSGLIVCAAVVSPQILNASENERTWNFRELVELPENTQWRPVDAHDRGYVTKATTGRCQGADRLNFDELPDHRRAYGHFVKRNQEVWPAGVDSRVIPVDFNSFDRVLLRYHHWVEDYSFISGKWIGLQLGRGWIGRDYAKSSSALYGTDGAGVNTMHPGRDDGNGIRLLASHQGQNSPFGSNFGDGQNLVPRGRWFTVDVVVDRYKGYRLYIDGSLESESSKVIPVGNWTGCGCLWYRSRQMHGGNPDKLPAINNYKEWFGGFFLAVA